MLNTVCYQKIFWMRFDCRMKLLQEAALRYQLPLNGKNPYDPWQKIQHYILKYIIIAISCWNLSCTTLLSCLHSYPGPETDEKNPDLYGLYILKGGIQRAGEREKEGLVIPSLWRDVRNTFKIKLSIGINLTVTLKYLLMLSFLSALRSKQFFNLKNGFVSLHFVVTWSQSLEQNFR